MLAGAPAASQGIIAFSSDRVDPGTYGNYEIYVMNADGSAQCRLTNHSKNDIHPALSPDGTQVAFASDRNNNNFEIYVMNIDGSGLTRLTDNSIRDNYPAFSPDGSKIAYTSETNNDGFGNIYVMNADGTGKVRLTFNSSINQQPRFSPDGGKLVFHSYLPVKGAAVYDIYSINIDGSGLTQLTQNTGGDNFAPSYSPDGSKIVFSSNRTGTYQLYLMNPDGSGQARLTDNAVNDYWPVFNPDGDRIAFYSYATGDHAHSDVYTMNADGSDRTAVTTSPAFDGQPSWSAGNLDFTRTVSIVPSIGNSGETVPAPVVLQARGDESAVGFSLIYDPAKLSNPVITYGLGGQGASIFVNDQHLAAGELGISIGRLGEETFSAGADTLMYITFTIAPGLTDMDIPLAFGDFPTVKEVADTLAQELPATWIDGYIRLNNPPVVDAGLDDALDEGSQWTRDGFFTDPDADAWTATVNYGDGSGTQALALNEDKTFTLAHTYADNGVYTVTVTVFDDTGPRTDTVVVTVANVVPVVDPIDDPNLPEGSTGTYTGAFTDPGADTWTGTVDYGDGSGVQPLVVNPNRTFHLEHTYLVNGVYTVNIIITDDDGGVGTYDAQVTITNVAPVVDAGPDLVVETNIPWSREGFFTDPGMDTWSGTVDFGDGTELQVLPLNPDKTFKLEYTYTDPGEYTVTVVITDFEGWFGADTVLVTVVPATYEADVAPRPDGNGAVTTTDWVQVGRFAAGLDTDLSDTELMRADCAPRATLGDGTITVSDWVQAGRYAVGLDPLTQAGGPAAAMRAATTIITGKQTRQIYIKQADAYLDKTIAIPIYLKALGDENAVGFTLNFDTSCLKFINASTPVKGASFILNNTRAAAGRLAMVVSLPQPRTFCAGENTVVILTFQVTAKAAERSTALTFSNEITRGAAANARAASLPVSFANGTVMMHRRR